MIALGDTFVFFSLCVPSNVFTVQVDLDKAIDQQVTRDRTRQLFFHLAAVITIDRERRKKQQYQGIL